MRLTRLLGSFGAVAATALFLGGCVATTPLTPSDFVGQSRVVDEALNGSVVVFSPFVRQPSPHPDVYRLDVRLIAAIDRRSGEARYSVEQVVEHRLGSWTMPRRARYLNGQGDLVSARWFDRDRGDVTCGGAGSCLYVETSRFGVVRTDVAALAGNVDRWQLRVEADRANFDAAIDARSVRAFYESVEFRAAKMASARARGG